MTTTYETTFTRNIGIISADEQQALRRSTVAIAGLGGIGGNTAVLLARMGIGRFVLADFDRFEPVNFNRQFGANVHTVGKPKVDVIANELRSINPEVEIHTLADGFTDTTAATLLGDADIAVDAIDFYAIEAHVGFHRAARAHGLHVVMGSPIGFSACLQIFDPEGMTFEEYTGIAPGMEPLEKQMRYACGVVPTLAHIDYFDVSKGSSNTDLMSRTGPSIACACGLAASLVATEIALILLRRRKPRCIPHTFQFDPYTFRYERNYIEGGMPQFDPTETIERVPDKTSFVVNVYDLLYRRAKAQTCAVEGGEISYSTIGEGPPVLLLSPLGSDSSFWVRQTSVFGKSHRVITVDLRGTGKSSPLPAGFTTRDMARDVASVVRKIGCKDVSVVGLALGGTVAQHLASECPELVGKLVLVSSYVKAHPQVLEVTARWREIADKDGTDKLFDLCLPMLFTDEYIQDNRFELDKLKSFYRLYKQRPGCFVRQSLAGVEHDGTDVLPRIASRTLVIHGQRDRLVPWEDAQRLVAGLRDASLHVMENGAHFLTWEQAKAFNSVVSSFLEG